MTRKRFYLWLYGPPLVVLVFSVLGLCFPENQLIKAIIMVGGLVVFFIFGILSLFFTKCIQQEALRSRFAFRELVESPAYILSFRLIGALILLFVVLIFIFLFLIE